MLLLVDRHIHTYIHTYMHMSQWTSIHPEKDRQRGRDRDRGWLLLVDGVGAVVAVEGGPGGRLSAGSAVAVGRQLGHRQQRGVLRGDAAGAAGGGPHGRLPRGVPARLASHRIA